VFGRVVGERGDPVGSGAIQGGVELGQGGVELLAVNRDVGDVLLTPLLMLGESGETLPKIALGGDCLPDPPFAGGDLGLGVGDGLTVVAAQAPLAGVLEPGPALR
jgi:hypothetical protein